MLVIPALGRQKQEDYTLSMGPGWDKLQGLVSPAPPQGNKIVLLKAIQYKKNHRSNTNLHNNNIRSDITTIQII